MEMNVQKLDHNQCAGKDGDVALTSTMLAPPRFLCCHRRGRITGAKSADLHHAGSAQIAMPSPSLLNHLGKKKGQKQQQTCWTKTLIDEALDLEKLITLNANKF